jgi:hypothetical protein
MICDRISVLDTCEGRTKRDCSYKVLVVVMLK